MTVKSLKLQLGALRIEHILLAHSTLSILASSTFFLL